VFERTGTSGGRTKQYGDILAMHKGALRVIDVMFSSKAEKTVKALEQEKTNQYQQNRVLHTEYFSPFLVTSNGGWGEQMTKYFKEARDALRTDPRMDSYQRQYFRYAKEMISLAVCKANWLYIRRMREGISRNSEAQELDQGVGVVDPYYSFLFHTFAKIQP